MGSRTKNLIRSADSPSLWNCTLAPGWTQEELSVLRLAIIKFGLGAWTKIIKSGCLPGKTPAQLNLQTQRMLGQQSLGEFYGIHLDAQKVWYDNSLKQGPQYVRKNGCLINAGNNPTKEERAAKIEANRKKYDLPEEVIESTVLPVLQAADVKQAKREKLKRLRETLAYMEQRLEKMANGNGNGNRQTESSPSSTEEKKDERHENSKSKKSSKKIELKEVDFEEETDESEEPMDMSEDDSDFEEKSQKSKKRKKEDEKEKPKSIYSRKKKKKT
jgi:hypothetical protein